MSPSTTAVPKEPSRALREAIEATVMAHARLAEEIDNDPGGFLRLTSVSTQALQTCESLQKEAVEQARRADHSWAEIGSLLGISRQAVQQRFSQGNVPDEKGSGKRRINWATGDDEMQVLNTVGAEGYHLVGLGGISMELEESDRAWEHRREECSEMDGKQSALEAEGWQYVGRWFPFHYFKREAKKKTQPAKPTRNKKELFPKEWVATHEGHQIRVRNSWNCGFKLFVDDQVVFENTDLFAVEKLTPFARARFVPDTGEPFVIEVFVYAMLTVKAKIAVNGQVIGGDVF